MMVEVSATGPKSLRAAAVESFVTGTMEVVLKHMGTAAWAGERLKMSVRPPFSQANIYHQAEDIKPTAILLLVMA